MSFMDSIIATAKQVKKDVTPFIKDVTKEIKPMIKSLKKQVTPIVKKTIKSSKKRVINKIV